MTHTNIPAFAMLGAVLLLTTTIWAQKPVAELPRVYIDTTWNEPKGGTTWQAHTAAELSAALAKSAPGDVIVLDAGATYSGNFALPAKDNPQNKWLYIESSALAKLPAGKRVSPDDAVNMPKIVTPSVMSDFAINSGANHWRLAGLELTAASNFPKECPQPGANCMTYNLVGMPGNPAVEPDSFTIDRCYIHGSPTQDLQGGVQMNASNFGVVDSYISDVHIKGFDSQALLAYWTPGPLKITNNYISAAGENIMFGGAGGPTTPWVPSDIQVQNNYIFKPLSWVPMSLPPIRSMVVKNAFEIKSAQRVLFDSNTIENVWAAGQAAAVVLTVRSSQSGDIAVVNDISITNNVLKNVVGGFATLAKDYMCTVPPYTKCHNPGSQDRWNISNNLILFYDPTIPGGGRNIALSFSGGRDKVNGGALGVMRNVVFQHNTTVPAASTPCWNSIYFDVPQGLKAPFSGITNNIWLLDNVLCRPPTGDWGRPGLTEYMEAPNASSQNLNTRFLGNVIYVRPEDRNPAFPPHNLSTSKAFRYVDPSQGNYDLLQPRWTETSDGKLAGVDSATLPR